MSQDEWSVETKSLALATLTLLGPDFDSAFSSCIPVEQVLEIVRRKAIFEEAIRDSAKDGLTMAGLVLAGRLS